MVTSSYVPDTADLIWLDFSPQAGRVQAGRRPAVVLSPAAYNLRSNLALVCPITNQQKGYPFEVVLPKGLAMRGVILADHVRSLDWRERRAEKAGIIPRRWVEDIRERLAARLGML